MIQTRGRPVTGSEIAAAFGVTLAEFNRRGKSTLMLRHDKVASIQASGTWLTPDGSLDRYFSIGRAARYVARSSQTAKTCHFSRSVMCSPSETERKKHEKRAERRRRLIAAGLYIDEFEAVL